MKKRNSSSGIPRQKRLKRPSRLQAARCWIPKYSHSKISANLKEEEMFKLYHENINSYFINNYDKYSEFELEVQEMVKSFYDPRIEEKGKIEGKIEGKIDILLKLLAKKFGEVPETYIERLKKLPEDVIDKVNLDVLEIKDIKEIEKYF